MKNGKLIRFDWAIKHLLRDKANFDILEGFLSALLQEKIQVISLLESESNQEHERDKFNRVDLLVESGNGQLILIEVQVESELDFFHRIVYGTAKLITEHIKAGSAYRNVKKVISISIAYFSLGRGKDYLYHGTTNFVGMNEGDKLALSPNQKKTFGFNEPRMVFPEHYIIRVENFDDKVKNAADEWIYMLKNSEVKPEFVSDKIQVASEKLRYMSLDEKEREEYQDYMSNESYHNSMIWSSHQEGWLLGRQKGHDEGLEKGLEKGRYNEKVEVVRNALQTGIPIETIASITKLDVDEVRRIQQELSEL